MLYLISENSYKSLYKRLKSAYNRVSISMDDMLESFNNLISGRARSDRTLLGQFFIFYSVMKYYCYFEGHINEAARNLMYAENYMADGTIKQTKKEYDKVSLDLLPGNWDSAYVFNIKKRKLAATTQLRYRWLFATKELKNYENYI